MKLSRGKLFGLAAIAGCSSYGIWYYRKNRNRLKLLTPEQKEAMYSPYAKEMYTDSDKNPILDVVFVHGFRGSLFRTWRQRDKPGHETVKFWPGEWLPKEFPDDPIRILGIDYPSKLLQFGKLMDSVEQRSEKLIAHFKILQVGVRPVVFVCHSMGGLLVKEMLLMDKNLLDKTVGILFIGTPHRGTHVISSYLEYLRPSHDTQMLKIDSKLSKELHQRFMDNACDKIPLIVSLVEMKKSPLFGSDRLIVTPESSTFDRGAVYHLDLNHYQLSKPDNQESPNYCIVVNFIRDAIKLVKKNS